MKKVSKSKVVVLAALFILLVSAFSFIAYAGTRNTNTPPQTDDCCLKAEPDGQMLWDVFSRQFISAVSVR